jgi:hypothetical protein
MTTEMWLIAAFRIAAALPVLRWPLAGAFIAIFADLADLFLREWLDLGGVKDYQRFDKWLDQAYMLTFLIVALRWEALPRNIAVALFVFREIGVIAFEITGDRDILVIFPNLFEYWFIFIAALKTFGWEDQPAISEHPARGAPVILTKEGSVGEPPHPTHATRDSEPRSAGRPPTSDLRPLISYLLPLIHLAIPYRYTRPQLAAALAVIIAAKLFHEYTLHVGQWFESFTPNEALEAIWRFLTPPY